MAFNALKLTIFSTVFLTSPRYHPIPQSHPIQSRRPNSQRALLPSPVRLPFWKCELSLLNWHLLCWRQILYLHVYPFVYICIHLPWMLRERKIDKCCASEQLNRWHCHWLEEALRKECDTGQHSQFLPCLRDILHWKFGTWDFKLSIGNLIFKISYLEWRLCVI